MASDGVKRLSDKPKRLAKFEGPVAIGIFSDGTIVVAGPNDPPVLIRDGRVLRPQEQPEYTRDIFFVAVSEDAWA